MHLKFSLITAFIDCNEKRRAEVVMEELGITYQHATPQSIADQWWFWNCQNLPKELPTFLTPLCIDPIKQIGFGLDEETAKSIKDREMMLRNNFVQE